MMMIVMNTLSTEEDNLWWIVKSNTDFYISVKNTSTTHLVFFPVIQKWWNVLMVGREHVNSHGDKNGQMPSRAAQIYRCAALPCHTQMDSPFWK